MKMHSAVGGRLGITGEDIEKLITLDEKDFEYREWLALTYTRDWIALDGSEPAGAYMDAFRSLYSRKERKYIAKLIRMMRFANYFNNTFRGRPWRSSLNSSAACSLGGGEGPAAGSGRGL